MSINKIAYVTLVLFFFLAAGTVFAQSFEIAGGVDIGWGNAVYEDDEGNDTSSGMVNVGLGLQIGAMWEKISILAEGDILWVFTNGAPKIMWNAGAVFEYYPLIFEDGETKLGIGLGVGYGSFLKDSLYARVEIPFIFIGGKVGINGEYYFVEKGPSYRVGIMYYLRGEQVLGFFQNQDLVR